MIQVYGVYSGEQISAFAMRGHTNHIRQILWHADDLGVFTSGLDGIVYLWT